MDNLISDEKLNEILAELFKDPTEEEVNKSLKKSDPICYPDHLPGVCPFNDLPNVVKWEILRQLEFRDYRNLAMTCRDWYQMAASAPLSVKPDLFVENFSVGDRVVTLIEKSPFSWLHFECHVDHLKFDFINKVRCREIILQAGLTSEITEYFLSNRSRFVFEFVWVTGCKDELFDLTMKLCELSTTIHFTCNSFNQAQLPRFLNKCLSHSAIYIHEVAFKECIHIIMDQWVNGKRPDLERLCVMSYRSTIEYDDIIVGIAQFVINQEVSLKELSARLVVPGLPEMSITSALHVFQDVGDEDICDDDGSYTKFHHNFIRLK